MEKESFASDLLFRNMFQAILCSTKAFLLADGVSQCTILGLGLFLLQINDLAKNAQML